jgi:hypothetical protein
VAQARDRARERAHARRAADQVVARAALAQLLLELAVAAHEAAPLDRAAHGRAHAVVVERLGEIVERAGANAVDRALDARVARDHDDLDLGMLALQALEQSAPAIRAEAEIEQHDVELGLGEPRLGSLRGLGERSAVAFALERPAQRAQQQRLVIDQEDDSGSTAFGRPVCAHRAQSPWFVYRTAPTRLERFQSYANLRRVRKTR